MTRRTMPGLRPLGHGHGPKEHCSNHDAGSHKASNRVDAGSPWPWPIFGWPEPMVLILIDEERKQEAAGGDDCNGEPGDDPPERTHLARSSRSGRLMARPTLPGVQRVMP